MNHYFIVALVSISGMYAQSTSTTAGSEIPLTKVRHLPRYCDAAFTADDTDNTMEISRESMELELWEKEETFWKLVSGYDLKQYLTPWDDDFVGYQNEKRSNDIAHIVHWIEAIIHTLRFRNGEWLILVEMIAKK